MGQDASSVVTNTAIYNNTVYNSAGPALRLINNNVSGITIKNNLFLTGGGQRLVDYGQSNGLTFVKNDYFNLSGAFSIWWAGSNYTSLAAWGQDSTGISSNPLLNNAGVGDDRGPYASANPDGLPDFKRVVPGGGCGGYHNQSWN